MTKSFNTLCLKISHLSAKFFPSCSWSIGVSKGRSHLTCFDFRPGVFSLLSSLMAMVAFKQGDELTYFWIPLKLQVTTWKQSTAVFYLWSSCQHIGSKTKQSTIFIHRFESKCLWNKPWGRWTQRVRDDMNRKYQLESLAGSLNTALAAFYLSSYQLSSVLCQQEINPLLK